jgi:hypothetical protein
MLGELLGAVPNQDGTPSEERSTRTSRARPEPERGFWTLDLRITSSCPGIPVGLGASRSVQKVESELDILAMVRDCSGRDGTESDTRCWVKVGWTGHRRRVPEHARGCSGQTSRLGRSERSAALLRERSASRAPDRIKRHPNWLNPTGPRRGGILMGSSA